MNKANKISDSEWEIMKVLWKNSPVTSSEIIKILKQYTSWSPKTIHTLINRLVDKDIVQVKKQKPFYLYSPKVSEEECRNIKTRSFLEKVYDGSIRLLISNFIKDEKLSDEEIDELRQILDSKSSSER
ncbi:BlaI/MecI/CopY family transcriptional regulator [Clostridium luticellarii]|uniref:Penicillinase repressor n=1 Tax=Clostridium luticellarii TaxID=1691940 RepID=A0A2T0B4P4_9CLOT|nr:BlaI/MecI/CopY family transcriptional regulator [Clostridium luticellarii]MCI1945687.1 BlaI/MecI/CopY family transcriptional regulator [Clostridium luticellarii]MCI1967443.1 BlaI/MecI/CopY family transcriptional regulator [Clostridium luticellarii]PRR78860.1 Penicillinase repressor [Clostridium luticellarii]